MNALVQKVQVAVNTCPFVVSGTKLTSSQAETKIWELLSDERIGISKDDPETHSLLDPALISERDLRTVFCDEGSVALPSLRCLMKHMFGENPTPVSEKDASIATAFLDALHADRPVGQYKTLELLEVYDADAPEDVWEEIRKRSKGQPCMAYSKGILDQSATNTIIQQIRKGGTFGRVYNDGEKAYRLYNVGVFPEETSQLCPITGGILSNGYSKDLKVSWKGVDEDCLVFIKILRDENPRENFSSKMVVKMLVENAKEGLSGLLEEWPEEALVYEELKSLNQLPFLRVNRNSLVAGRKLERRNDPLGRSKRS